MANRIVGLDIGTWAVKAVTIELQRQLDVVDYREIQLSEFGIDEGDWGADGTVDGQSETGGPLPPWEDTDDGEPTAELFPEVDDANAEMLDDEDPDADLVGGNLGEPLNDATLAGQGPGGDWTNDPREDDEGFGPEDDGPVMPAWTIAVERLQEEGFFEGVNQVITSFPDGRAVTLHLDVPFERPGDVADILPHLLMDELPLPLRELVYDFIVVPGKELGQWEALVGFLQREEMSQFLGQCRWAGMEPSVVGVPELMLRYVGDQAVRPGIESYGIIDIGHQFTRLLIMSEGKPVIAHTTRRGGAAVTDALAENFQISDKDARRLKHKEGVVGIAARGGDAEVRKVSGTIEEALRPIVRDLRRTFQSAYAKYQVAVDAIYICGGTSRLRGIEDYLHGEFEVDVQLLPQAEGVTWSVDADKRSRMPEAALALGSALQKPLDSTDRNLIDFRQDEFVYRGKSSYLRRQVTRIGLVAAVLMVMLFGVLAMQHYDQRAQLAAMEAAVAEQTQQLFGESVNSSAEVQALLQGDGGVDRSFIPRMSAYEIMFRIVDQISEDIELEVDRFDVDTSRGVFQLTGETTDPNAVEQMATEISRVECLSSVDTERITEREDRVQFELQIASRCS